MPHDKPHGVMRIPENQCMLLPKAQKMRAIKQTMALITDSIGCTKCAPAQMPWHLRHLNPALLNRQGMNKLRSIVHFWVGAQPCRLSREGGCQDNYADARFEQPVVWATRAIVSFNCPHFRALGSSTQKFSRILMMPSGLACGTRSSLWACFCSCFGHRH